MTPDIIERLNAINRDFYRVTAPEFDQTRGQAWQGWQALLPYIPATSTPLRVLDVGCGNGRFGVFLGEQGISAHYHGVDNNPALLAFAREALADYSLIETHLTERDSILQDADVGLYDLVVLFGVLHHVPGDAFRQAFMRQLAQRVAVGGILAFASWRFYEFERFRTRVVPWEDDLATKIDVNDYLLDWRRGEHAVRYCHYVDDREEQLLIQSTDLTPLITYRADGYNNTVNSYCVLQRKIP